jgi:hypothetical protein
VQMRMPAAKLGFRPALSEIQLQKKPPKNCPTALMILNAACQLAGRTASPLKIYLYFHQLWHFSFPVGGSLYPKSRLNDGTPIMAPLTCASKPLFKWLDSNLGGKKG